VASIRDIPDPSAPSSLGSLEIELKTGRVIHARPDERQSCAILPGPARTDPRRWRDLTPDLPFAFARDAVIGLAEPVERERTVVGLRVVFADGAQFVYDTSNGRPRLETSTDDITGARS
jgi:hypothetical protein